MSANAYRYLSALIFFLVAVAHGLRVVLAWPVRIAHWELPFWVSVLALVILSVMAYSAIRLQDK